MKKILTSIKDFVLWLFFTKQCRYCGELIEKNRELCPSCEANLPRIIGEKCKCCGAGKDRCTCKKHKMKFDGISAPFYYEEGIRKAVQRLKFNRQMHLARILAREMAEAVKNDFAGVNFDFICYVPFSFSQAVDRAYNQSELLAYALSKELGIPVKRALKKLGGVGTQHEMTPLLRKGNVHGVFEVKGNAQIKDKTVLLVDDIMTTGETLNNCAVIMKIRGARAVYCTTAAKVAKKKKENS